MFNFVIYCSTRPSRTVDFGTCPRRAKATTPKAIFENGRLSGLFCRWQCAQRHSKNSNGRLSGLFCWPQGQDIENSSAQLHSKMTKWELGVLGKRHIIKNSSAQQDSKFSKWKIGVLRSLGILGRKTEMENTPAQLHSKICKSNGSLTVKLFENYLLFDVGLRLAVNCPV